jgi:hypothetical protein
MRGKTWWENCLGADAKKFHFFQLYFWVNPGLVGGGKPKADISTPPLTKA